MDRTETVATAIVLADQVQEDNERTVTPTDPPLTGNRRLHQGHIRLRGLVQ